MDPNSPLRLSRSHSRTENTYVSNFQKFPRSFYTYMGVGVRYHLPIHPRKSDCYEVCRPSLDVAIPCRRVKRGSSIAYVIRSIVITWAPAVWTISGVHNPDGPNLESLPFLKNQFLSGSLSLADLSLKFRLVEVAHTIRMNGDDIECVAA